MFCQEGNVARTLAQGRQAQLDDIDTVKQILAEAATDHLGRQVAMGSADQAYIDGDLPLASDRTCLLFLQDAQQLDLGRQGQFCHLVEEEGAAIRGLE